MSRKSSDLRGPESASFRVSPGLLNSHLHTSLGASIIEPGLFHSAHPRVANDHLSRWPLLIPRATLAAWNAARCFPSKE